MPELWTLGGSSRYETILAINHLVQRRRCAGAVYGERFISSMDEARAFVAGGSLD